MLKKILFIFLFLSLFIISCKPAGEPPRDEGGKPSENIPPKPGEEEAPAEEVRKGKLFIEYHFNDDDMPDEVEEIKDLSTYQLISPTRVGFNFVGWCTTDALTVSLKLNSLSMPEGAEDEVVMAYAKWKAAKYNVRFICDDQVIATRYLDYGAAAKAPNPTLKSGFVFKGWDADFSYVTKDIDVHAIYEEGEGSHIVLVVLGNYLNDNGTMSDTLRKRLDLTLEAYAAYNPDFIVVTGGMANSKAGVTEANVMYNYLKVKGIPEQIIIQEGNSLSTYQNAVYTMQLLENIDFDTLIIVSTIEHFVNYQTIKYFDDAALANEAIKAKDIKIMIYTNSGNY